MQDLWNMSDISSDAKSLAKEYPYLADESEEKAMKYAELAGKAIEKYCEEPELKEICETLEVRKENINHSQNVRPQEIALAAWSNLGAGTFEQAVSETHLNEQEFVILHDNFKDLIDLVQS